jgi:hypothetical protein
VELVAVTIDKKTESKILEEASHFDGKPIEIGGTSITVIGKKKFGVEGGAILSLSDRRALANERRYVAKVMFKDGDVRGTYFYSPNAKSFLRSWCEKRTRKEINVSVMQEFTALKLARVINPQVVPDAQLGCVEEENGQKRLFLMTEQAGQDNGEIFKNFEDKRDANISKEMWQSAFAISVGLLNDQDVNNSKGDNVGVVSSKEGNRLCLFDLGHPTPDKFKLDPRTLLPKSTSLFADILLWAINLFTSAKNLPWTFTMAPDIKDKLSVEERKKSLLMVLDKKYDILKELSNMIEGLPEGSPEGKAIEDLKIRIEKRMDYLQKILENYEDTLVKA